MTEEEIFHHAVELPAAERNQFVKEACKGDSDLEACIFALLSAHDDDEVIVDQACGEAETVHAFLEVELSSRDPFSSISLQTEPDKEEVLQPGTCFGEYLIEAEIGKGATGRVYRAIQTGLNRPVALKLIRNSLLVGKKAVDRFYAEAEAAAGLDHPNLVPIFEVNELDGLHYYCMKLVQGDTLSNHVQGLKENLREGVKLMRKVALAIHHAHQKRLLHCDIKPGNILVDGEGEPHVGDFGLATHFDSAAFRAEQRDSPEGTPYYMAPEQADGQGHTLTTATDVFSLGAVLYEVATGERPFQAATLKRAIQELVHSEPASPESLNRKVDSDLSAIIGKCLEKQPEDRYPSASAFAADLTEWLERRPVAARPVNTRTKVLMWIRRSPQIALFWGAILALVFALGVGGYFSAHRQFLLREKAQLLAKKEAEASAKALELAGENRRNLYFAEMNAASQLDSAGYGRVRETLEHWIPDSTEKDLRGWEWNYLSALERNNLVRYDGHTRDVTASGWSPDGTLIATSGFEGGIRIWSPETGEEVARLDLPMISFALCWSSDGKHLIAGQEDGTLVVWKPFSSSAHKSFPFGEKTIGDVSLSPEGNRFAVGGRDGTFGVFDAETCEPICLKEGYGNIVSVDWSRDGNRVAVSNKGMMFHVLDAETGESLVSPSRDELQLRYLDWHPTDEIVAGESNEFSVRLIDPMTLREVGSLAGHYDLVNTVAWSPAGDRLATASRDHTVRIWGKEQMKPLTILYGADRAMALSWSPDGRKVVFGDGRGARVCDAVTVEPTVLGKPRHWVDHVDWSPDGIHYLTISGDRSISVWNADEGSEILSFRGQKAISRSASWSPDGSMIASVSKDIALWNPENGEIVSRWNGHEGFVFDVAWMPDGKRIATVGRGDRLRLWDVETHEMLLDIVYPTPKSYVRPRIAISPNGHFLAASDQEGDIIVWDAITGEEQATFKEAERGVYSLAWSPDSEQLVVGYQTGQLSVFDLKSANCQWSISAHYDRIYGVSWSPDGTRLATVGGDRMLRLWDSETGAACLTLRAHDLKATSVDWSPDGSRILTGSEDMTSKVWDSQIRPSNRLQTPK